MRPSVLSFILLTLCTWLPRQETPPPAPTLDRQQVASRLDELKSLRNYLEKAGGGERAGERIKFTMQRVKLRGQALKRTLRRDVAAELSSFRSHRFELEDQIFFLTEAWKQAVDSTALKLNESEAKAFRKTATTLLGPYRMALLEERDGLTVLIGVGQELQVALLERRTALDALETFIRSKGFWIRDAKPLGPELWSQAVSETAVVTSWGRDLGRQGSTRFADSLTRPVALTMLLLVVVLPIGLYWARQRVRRFVTRMNDRTVNDDARIGDRLLAVGGGILSVALLPIFLFILSRSLGTDWGPWNLAPVLGGLLGHLAVFLLFWFLSRSSFAGRGTVQVQFGMDRDAAHTGRLRSRATGGRLVTFLPSLNFTVRLVGTPPYPSVSPSRASDTVSFRRQLPGMVKAAVLLELAAEGCRSKASMQVLASSRERFNTTLGKGIAAAMPSS